MAELTSQTLTGTLVALMLPRTLALGLGIDHQNTLDVSTPLSKALFLAATLIVGCAAVYAWFGLSDEQLARTKFWRLKHDRPGFWYALGISYVTLSVLATCWLVAGYLRTCAQYMDGSPLVLSATVKSNSVRATAATACERRLALSVLSERSSLKFCLKIKMKAPIGPEDLEVNERVRVRIQATVLGHVVKLVERDPNR